MALLEKAKSGLLSLQDEIVNTCSTYEKTSFITDEWLREEGGGGRTCVFEQGIVWEKAGVNFSHVHGKQLPKSATQHRPELAGGAFEAMGVSLVIHPHNPFVPTSHMNVRLFQVTTKEGASVTWFGGGYDLTPYYGFDEDCIHWHQTAKTVCDQYSPELYPSFKRWCDEYFYLKHRQEPRGVGGIFFDDFNDLGDDQTLDFILSVGASYLKAYMPIVDRRKDTTYTHKHKQFQTYRRGRYVEFNLVYDRGTLFGLQSQGRTESILMSLPPEVSWKYNFVPKDGSEEAKLTNYYLTERNWLVN